MVFLKLFFLTDSKIVLCALTIPQSYFAYQIRFLYYVDTFTEKSKFCDEKQLETLDTDWYRNQSNTYPICETSIKGCRLFQQKDHKNGETIEKGFKDRNKAEMSSKSSPYETVITS